MNIMLYAYVDENIGDDLFIDLICKRYKDIQFYLYIPVKYLNYYSNLKNLHCIPMKSFGKNTERINRWLFKERLLPILYWNRMYNLDKLWIKKMDGNIWLGGSQFVETRDWKSVIKYKIKQQQLKQIPFFSISATVGPFKTEEYETAVKMVIAGYKHIVFRDKWSYERMGEKANSSYAYDMVFTKKLLNQKKEKEVCISVIDTYGRFADEIAKSYEKWILSVSKYFLEKGYKLNFLSLCNNHHDNKAIQRIIKSIPLDKVSVYSYSENMNEIISIISKSEIMVGTRYHSIVLGLKLGLKVLPVIYESKTENLLDMLGVTGIKIDNLLGASVENANNLMIQLSEVQIINISQNAEHQYFELDKWMKEERQFG